MKPALAMLPLLLVFVPMAEAAAPHSENVAGASQAPQAPNRGDDVKVTLFVKHNATIDHVRLVYCRAQNYACARPLNMTMLTHGTWIATIPWQDPGAYRFADFWKGVTDVGYNATLFHQDGHQETSPTVNSPYDPGGLAPDSHYYFYKLPPEAKGAPGPGAPILVVLVAAVAWMLRKRA